MDQQFLSSENLEQMTQAYDFGVQKLWIVNVGDIATQEFPLSFFMDLAYDFERWGTTAPNTTDAYTRLWVKRQFGRLSEVQQAQIAGYPDGLYKDDTQVQTGGVKTGNLSCSKLS